jgi:accessory gene regulator protein AgrB
MYMAASARVLTSQFFICHLVDNKFLLQNIVLLLGIFRRAPRPSDTRGHPCALPLKKKKKNLLVIVLNVLKLMRKHFIDPKSSEILSIFQVFPCTTQIALFWPKLLPALFLKKP